MKRIRTTARLDQPPERVWDILADFDRYAEWNPLNIQARGEARLGARIPMTFLNLAKPGGGDVIRQTVRLVACERGRSLAWAGNIPLLFRGRHHFELEPDGEGTLLRHGEDLAGLIPAGFSEAQIAGDFVPAYEAVNQALAQRLAAL